MLNITAEQQRKLNQYQNSKYGKKAKHHECRTNDGGSPRSAISNNTRKMSARKSIGAKIPKAASRKLTNVRSSNMLHQTMDMNLRDDVSDISDITHRSRSCFKRECCIEKEKIMSKLGQKKRK